MKHLELIQNALSRMGNNSANLKGYCMSMVAAIIGLAAAVSKQQIILYSLPIVAVFAFLDASLPGPGARFSRPLQRRPAAGFRQRARLPVLGSSLTHLVLPIAGWLVF